jgi:hypothetical protein
LVLARHGILAECALKSFAASAVNIEPSSVPGEEARVPADGAVGVDVRHRDIPDTGAIQLQRRCDRRDRRADVPDLADLIGSERHAGEASLAASLVPT